MNRFKLALMPALMGVAAAFGVTFGATGPAHAQIWSEYAMVSATMGVSDSRVCLGEGSRGDIGCPAYAPYVNATTGNVGIGTSTPAYSLDIIPANNYMRLGASDSAGELLLGNGTSSPGFYAPAVFGRPINPARYMTILSEIQSADDTGTNAALLIGARVSPSNLVGTRPTIAFRNNSRIDMLITAAGKVGISTTSPQATLDVGGTVRFGNGAEICDVSRTGAIKYQSGDFFYCRNGTAWESLTSLSGGGGAAGDRITSGTTGIYAYGNTSASIATAGVERIVIGTGGNVGIGQQPVSGIALSTSGTSYLNGTVRASGEVISTGANQFRMVQGNYGAFWRNDGTELYLLLTASGDQYGAWNTLRPFMVNLATGGVTMNHGLTVGGTVAATSFSGDGSGLTNVTATNANTLDGLDSTAFVLKSGSTMTGTLQVPYLNVAAQGVEGGEIQLLKGTGQSNLAGNVVFDTASDLVRFYEAGGSYRQFNFNLVNGALTGPAGTFWHNGNDGAGSGLDADTVDGVQASGLLTKAGVTAGNACIGNGTTVDCSDANVGTRDDLTTRTPSGFWETNTATTAEGWPVSTNNWYHLLTSTHNNTANYFSMQFAGDFFSSNNIFYRATNGSGATSWNRLWHNGNDGSGSGLDADTLDGVDSAALLRNGQTYSGDNVLTIAGTAASNDIWSPGLEIREVGMVGNGSADSSYAPGITFHWSNVVGSAIKMYSDGSFRFKSQSSDPYAYRDIFANNLWITGLGDWITNRLGQDVRAGATPNFANIWVNSLGGYATDVFMGKIVNTWHNSSEGAARFYFANGGRTYVRANNGDGFIASFRGGDEADKVHIAQDGNIWLSRLGVWLSDWLNQDVKTTANATFNNLYLSGLGDWITNRLGQDVRAGSAPYFTAISTNGTGIIDIHGGIRTRRGLTSWGTATNYFSINWTGSAAQLYIDSSNMGTISLSSDRRLKKDIEPLADTTGGLSKIMQLNPVSFHWKNTADDPSLQFGLIAQEVSPVFPNLVRNTGMKSADTPDGILKIEYQGLIAPMIKAIQELKTENDALKAKIEAANDNFARLEKEIQALKQGR